MGLPIVLYESEESDCEPEVHDCVCRCDHDGCDVLRKQSWCRYWFIVHWVPTTFVGADALVRKIKQCIGAVGVVRRWGSYCFQQGEHQYRVLVMVDPAGPGLSDKQIARLVNPQDAALGVSFKADGCFAAGFRCCRLWVKESMPGWVASIRGQRRSATSFMFGDEGILDEWESWVRILELNQTSLDAVQ